MKKTAAKIFNKNTLKIVWVVYALLSIVTVLCFADILLRKDLDVDSDRLLLNSNWNITINEQLYENVNLDSFRFDAVNKGSRIVMERTLPDDWDFENTAITLHIRQTTVDLYIDNECFYEYGHERVELGKTVGSGIQLINFSNEYKGKEFKIVLNVTEDLAFSSFDPIYLSEWNDSFRLVISENRLALFLGAFLVVFGIAVSLVSIFAVISSKKYANILCLSCFSIFMGLWTLCYHNITVIFSIPLYSASLLEYMSLLLAPLPIVGYMYSYVKQLQSKGMMLSYWILFGAQITVSVVTIVLHTTDTIHSAALLPYSQILFVVHAIFFTYVLLKNSRLNLKRTILYAIGFAVIISSIVYDLIIYVINRYAGLQLYSLKGVSSLGIITFIGILIIDFAHDITSKMMEEKEKEMLIKRAYTDELTQINNRTFCSEYTNTLQSEISQTYTIFSFDLNDLKKVNDTHGHTKGDLLIKSAAAVISETFSSSGVVGRMGGDEFIAILPTSAKSQIEKLTADFNSRIINANKNNPDLHLSISYGYAASTEIEERNTEKVYQLADDRMYENKKTYKNR